MATVIKLKRGTSTPTTSNITSGEVAVDTSAKKLYINDSGTVKEIGGQAGALNDLTNVTDSNTLTGHYLNYNGSNWRNEFDFRIGKHVPFTKNDGTVTTIPFTNSNSLSTPTQLLNNVVKQNYYFPFTKSDGTAVTSITLGTIDNTELTNSTISVAADSGTTNAVDLGDTLTVAGDSGSHGVSSTVSGDTLTVGIGTSPTFGSSSSDSVTFNARIGSHFIPDTNITYDLGTSSLRWRDIYLSGNTIDLNGATISGDGTGAIAISSSGVTLPAGSTAGSFKIATADPNSGLGIREVPFFTTSGGLGSAAKTFKFGMTAVANVFTHNHTFTLTSSANAGAVTLFDF